MKDELDYTPISHTNDYVFKKIFSDKEILSDLLSGFLRENISVVEILNPEIPPESLTDKLGRMDILATDKNKELFNVDVQIQYHEGFDDRMLYYGAKVYSSSVRKGKGYYEIKRTVMINILAFSHRKLINIPRYHTTFKLRNEDSSVTLTEKFVIHYIEVPKIMDLLKNTTPDKLSKEDKWVLYLNDCGGEVMEQIVTEEPMIARALTIGELFSKDKAEQQRARQREEAVAAWSIAMGANYHSGLEKGIEKGMEKGMENLVRNMLLNRVAPDFIAKNTGLSLDKIMSIEEVMKNE
ncbi:hypothetical protein FACS1894187_01940 [Synergistales bacterium]|nr:hypothetical protein FACS1894187_01940 [Synergistales bacterium]